MGLRIEPVIKQNISGNLKKYATLMGRKMSPRYSQVMMVSGYSSLAAVNKPSLESRRFELTDYTCE